MLWPSNEAWHVNAFSPLSQPQQPLIIQVGWEREREVGRDKEWEGRGGRRKGREREMFFPRGGDMY